MTPEELKEYAICRKDPVYFINNYCKVEHPAKGVIPFILYDFQKEIVKSFRMDRYNVINKSRQTGLSTITASYALWLAMFRKNQKITIISIKDDDAQIFLQKIKVAYSALPKWMKDEPEVDNAHELTLTTKSTIRSVPSSSNAARGQSLTLLIIDEAAFIDNLGEIWKSALPTLSKGGSTIMISTPNGLGNTFYEIWRKSSPETPKEDKNEFKQTFVHWTQVPDYRGDFDPFGMPFQDIVEKAKQQEWYTKMRPNFDDRQWAQEFEGDFLGSGLTVVKPERLKYFKPLLQEPKYKTGPHDGIWVWKDPVPGETYVVAADVASGEGDDYSTIQVLNARTGEQCCEFQGKLSILDFSELAVNVAKRYNYGLLIPEWTGLGAGMVQKIVYELGYSNIFETVNEKTKKRTKATYGWHTTATTRPLLIAQVQKYFNEGDFDWYSSRLWHELTTFVWKDNVKAEADGSNNDDLVMAFAIAAHNREASLMFQPADLKSDIYEFDVTYEGMMNITEDGRMLDPYSLDEVDIPERDVPMDPFDDFDPDSEADVQNWLIN